MKTQALDNLLCCLHPAAEPFFTLSGGSRGGARGPHPLPLFVLDQMEARRAEKVFWGDRPPPISGSGSGSDPARFWRSHERLCIRSLLSMRGMLLRYSFEPRPKGRVLVTLVLVMTIDQSINGCSYSEKKKTVWRESTRLTSPEVWAAVSVLKGLTRSRGASFSPPNSRRSKRISARGVCCV